MTAPAGQLTTPQERQEIEVTQTTETRQRARRVTKVYSEVMKLSAALQVGVPSVKTLRLLAEQAGWVRDELTRVADDFDAMTPEHRRGGA